VVVSTYAEQVLAHSLTPHHHSLHHASQGKAATLARDNDRAAAASQISYMTGMCDVCAVLMRHHDDLAAPVDSLCAAGGAYPRLPAALDT
jgi:hypothetical protein